MTVHSLLLPAGRAAIVVAAAVVLVFAAGAQVGVSGPSVVRPRGVVCTNMELHKQVPCSDAQTYFFEGEALVEAAFNGQKFAELERLYDGWCEGTDRLPDGRWKLVTYGSALAKNFDSWNIWTRHLETIKAWQLARPSSEAARYAEAVYWHTYAWKARGPGYRESGQKQRSN